VIDAIEQADGIIITPSNPLISIGPILAVPVCARPYAGDASRWWRFALSSAENL